MEANTAPLDLAPHPLEGDHDVKIWWMVGPHGNSTIVDYVEVRSAGNEGEGAPGSYVDWVMAHGNVQVQDICDAAAEHMAPGIYLWEGVARWSVTSRAQFIGVFTYHVRTPTIWDAVSPYMPTPLCQTNTT